MFDWIINCPKLLYWWPWGKKKIKRNDGSDVGHLMPIILGLQLMQQLCVLRFRSESLIIIRVAAAAGPSALRPGTQQAASSNSKVLPIFYFFLQSPDILFYSDCNLSVRTVVTLAPNRLLKFKRSPPSLPNTPNAALNEAILFIGAVGGLWVTLRPFKKDNMLPI